MQWTDLAQCSSAEELARGIRTILEEGPFEPGERLPTLRDFASYSGLGRSEVYRAVVMLSADGWVVQKRGSGTYVGPRKEPNSAPTSATRDNGRGERRIGVIPPAWDPQGSHSTVGAILHGIAQQAGSRGYRIEVVSASGADYMTPAFADRVLSLQLDGAIWVQPAYELSPALTRLREARLPLVLSGRSFPGVEVPAVVMDYAWLGEAVAEFMIRYGRTRLVAFVGCRDDTYTAGHVEGIRTALEKRGLEFPDDRLLTVRIGHTNRFYSIDLMKVTREFLDRHRDFDAVYSMYPDTLDALFDLHKSGKRRCPQDYVHIHFARTSLPLHLPWQDMPISFMEPTNEAIGRQTVRVLERMWGVEPVDEDEIPQPILVEDPRLAPYQAERIQA